MNKDTGREVAVKIMRLPLAGTASFGPAPGSGQATSRSGVSGAAESTELDVFKEIEILKTLDQCVVGKRGPLGSTHTVIVCLVLSDSYAAPHSTTCFWNRVTMRSPSVLKMHEYFIGAFGADIFSPCECHQLS